MSWRHRWDLTASAPRGRIPAVGVGNARGALFLPLGRRCPSAWSHRNPPPLGAYTNAAQISISPFRSAFALMQRRFQLSEFRRSRFIDGNSSVKWFDGHPSVKWFDGQSSVKCHKCFDGLPSVKCFKRHRLEALVPLVASCCFAFECECRGGTDGT